eukprot:1176816-Prorocentrum_minimum.AAC.2
MWWRRLKGSDWLHCGAEGAPGGQPVRSTRSGWTLQGSNGRRGGRYGDRGGRYGLQGGRYGGISVDGTGVNVDGMGVKGVWQQGLRLEPLWGGNTSQTTRPSQGNCFLLRKEWGAAWMVRGGAWMVRGGSWMVRGGAWIARGTQGGWQGGKGTPVGRRGAARGSASRSAAPGRCGNSSGSLDQYYRRFDLVKTSTGRNKGRPLQVAAVTATVTVCFCRCYG